MAFAANESYGTRQCGLIVGVGPQITAATTITPTYTVHHVTGLSVITTFTTTNLKPGAQFMLIADALLIFTTAGNLLNLPTIAIGGAYIFTYDGSKWYGK